LVADCACAWSMTSVNIAKAKAGAARSRFMSQRLIAVGPGGETDRWSRPPYVT
jgi:hypothetical protein